MAIPYSKPALSFIEQLNLLQGRGLVVDNQHFALNQLASISYYRLSAYWHPFWEMDENGNSTGQFRSETTFSEVIKLYEFDRHLRLLVMDAIERIEVHVRTLVTYHMGQRYNAFGHTDSANFHPQFNHALWLSKLEGDIAKSKDVFIEHYKNKYDGFPRLPIWMSTEVMSFGSLSIFYKGLKNEDKRQLASQLGIHHKRLKDWLHTLTYIRNICAHHSRLWNRELAIRPETVRDSAWNAPVTPRQDRVFYILLILRVLLRSNHNGEHWAERCSELLETLVSEKKYRIAMGLPENWKEHPIWR